MFYKLQELGLSYYEAKALEIALKETLTVKQLSRKAKIPLGKVYSVLNSLKAKELINSSDERPAKISVQNASDVISKLISQKEKKHEHLLLDLREFAAQIDIMRAQPTKFFQVGTTIDDNKEIQLRTFTEAQKEVCQILNMHHKPNSNRAAKTIWEKEIESAVKRGVQFKSIYPVNAKLPQILDLLSKKHPQKFQVRRLDTDFTRCDIIDSKKVLIKLVHGDAVNYGGVIFTENEKLAKNLKQIFEQFWEQAK